MNNYPSQEVNGGQILTFGILSLVCCSIFGPFAWYQGNKAMEIIDYSSENRQYYASERGLVIAGRICGVIGSILLLFGVFAAVIHILFAGGGR